MTAAAEVYGVSCVMSALVARNAVVSFGEDIDNLAFSFIAPLKANDCNILLHRVGWAVRHSCPTFRRVNRRTPESEDTIKPACDQARCLSSALVITSLP